jgi:hypothetical protein
VRCGKNSFCPRAAPADALLAARRGPRRGTVLEGICAARPVVVADKARHARLLTHIAELDQAIATENREQSAAAGAALVETWKEVVAFMQARHGAESSRQSGSRNWLVQLAKLARWPGTGAGEKPPTFEFVERPWGWLMSPAEADNQSGGSIK